MSLLYTTKSVYQKIAIDIANRILNGDISIGDKLYGRSSLASLYQVSPETVRKAVMLLHELGIVEVVRGSGIIVKSVDNCLKLLSKFKDIDFIDSSKNEILNLLNKKAILDKKIQHKINEFIDYSDRFANINPFMPYAFKLKEKAAIIGKTIAESKFRQHTNATIVGIKREGKLILAPDPCNVIKTGDTLFVIGAEDVYHRIKRFIDQEQ
ncbi:MAG: GntR family transcriptional regulator [Sporolactobacillus sp.]|jgi:K+/H+ antiporter YhaU regulatory subunit KhtT|nr:GntR family transcriptional regulator [Sporolactobacillus sp.]MCI1882375.1 GntR family transcriptional regulator [Sporolactobacillus sp.]